VRPGDALHVQVSGYAEPGKAIPVTPRVLFKSRHAIVTPEAPGLNVSRRIRDDDIRDTLLEIAHDVMDGVDMGLILRSSCAEADPEAEAADIADMRDLARAVMSDKGAQADRLVDGDDPWQRAWRDWPASAEVIETPGAFATHGVEAQIAAARQPRIALGSFGTMYVEPTRALVAVDVNTGADGSFAAGLKANLAPARALPRALRVRGLGGQITLDLAPMPKKDRRNFESALRGAFRGDDVDTVLAGWTPLGLYELQRKRSRMPLSEVLT